MSFIEIFPIFTFPVLVTLNVYVSFVPTFDSADERLFLSTVFSSVSFGAGATVGTVAFPVAVTSDMPLGGVPFTVAVLSIFPLLA